MKNVLVTGGAGFIGSNFVRYLLKAEPELRVINLDALTYAGSLENLKDLPDESRHTFIQGDICDEKLVARMFSENKIDTVVHFAAESHVDRSILGPGAVYPDEHRRYVYASRSRAAGLGRRKRSERDSIMYQPMKSLVH